MVKVRFGVFQIGACWNLCLAEVRLQTFASKLDAMTAAGRAVLVVTADGHEAELHVMDTGGLLRQVAPKWLTR